MKRKITERRSVFIDDVLSGRATYDDLENYVDKWHECGGCGVELHEYLGLTWKQYAKWAGDDDGFKPEFDNIIKELKIARRISRI